MRRPRFIATGRCYHLISRLAHQAFFLTKEERTRAVDLMRRVEEFSGVIVLAYAFMTNHFHIFIYVPERETIDDDEILRRIKVLYRDSSLDIVLSEWNRLKKEEETECSRCRPTGSYISRFSQYKEAFLRRMWNSAEFMKTYKQHFTMSYNWRREHMGTMWEGRYHERNHELEKQVMWKTAAYIDVNPVTAGIVTSSDSYEWCSIAAARKGDEKARRGYVFMYGESGGWDAVSEKHEVSIREALAEIAAEREEIAKRPTAGPRAKAVKAHQLKEPREYAYRFACGDPDVVERIVKLLDSGPMAPADLRKAVGMRNRTYFNRHYLTPLLANGLIERTDSANPNSPQQRYRKVG